MFQDKVVVITGGAGGIGKCIREEFEKTGAKVCVIDIADNPYFVGDIGDETTLRRFAEKVIGEHGRVDCLINNAPPLFKGISECTYEVRCKESSTREMENGDQTPHQKGVIIGTMEEIIHVSR